MNTPFNFFNILLLLCFLLEQNYAANILGVIPTASYSHQIPFQPIWRELSLRGHRVTVITTDPMKDPTLTNLTEIDISYTYQIYEKYNFSQLASDESKSFLEIANVINAMFNESFDTQLLSSDVQQLLHDKGVTFDLVILEAQAPMAFGFSWKFKCPVIGVASLDAAIQFHDSAGNPTHPLVNPDNNLPIDDVHSMTFKDRFVSFLYNTIYKLRMYYFYYPQQNINLKKYFGADLPAVVELQNNISMLFVSTNPIFHNPRPLNPNTIEIGYGLHMKPPKVLPKDLKQFLDESTEGVIYFSLGSNVDGNSLNESTQEAIRDAFADLPYKILLKLNLINI